MRKILVILFIIISIIFIYMSIETWGLMPKSQVDGETIEEAIERLIAVHEHEPTSHMGENESIEAHRKSEVIDHLASSVYDDKLAYDRNTFDIKFSDLAIFDHGSGVELNGIDTVYMNSANSSNTQWLYGSVGDMINSSIFYYTKKPRILLDIMLTNTTSQQGYLLAGYRDEYEGFGFKILNNKIYGFYYDSSHAEQTLEIQTVTAYTVYKLEARVININTIEFYINNVFVDSFTSITLSSTNEYGWNIPWIEFKSTTSTSRSLYIRGYHWEADL